MEQPPEGSNEEKEIEVLQEGYAPPLPPPQEAQQQQQQQEEPPLDNVEEAVNEAEAAARLEQAVEQAPVVVTKDDTPPVNNNNQAPVPPEGAFTGQDARMLASELLHTYFTSQTNPFTKHHIDSFDQFLSRDLMAIIRDKNPITVLKEPLDDNNYMYKVEVYVGGPDSTAISYGTPAVSLEQGKDVRILYPNEARLRNLTYALQVECDLHIHITMLPALGAEEVKFEPIIYKNFPLCSIPLMLHSRYCVLHNKPKAILKEMGECHNDQGGYFVIEGSEKVLVTRQEGAFNTLYIQPQPHDPKIEYYASMSCLNSTTRQVRRIAFYWTRERTSKHPFTGKIVYTPSVLEVSVPFVRKPVPVFVLFRALGVQTDKDIMNLIFPDFENPESKYLMDMLIPSINSAFPFLDTYSSLQYMKTLTKGFTLARVLDTVTNHLFAHIENRPGAKATFLAECVRQILRVVKGIEAPPSKDSTRNQRLLSSGFLTQMLFQSSYNTWTRAVSYAIDTAYNYNKELYSGESFRNIFQPGNLRAVFKTQVLNEAIMKGFKGKWPGSSGGDVEAGVLQALSRLSYLDFMSHCRRVVLDFDTSMKLTGPRKLDPSQFGYFCTNETPSGSHIGVTKNLTVLTSISTSAPTANFVDWLYAKGTVVPCGDMTPKLASVMVPVFLNGGIVGYTGQPKKLSRVLSLLKRTGHLPSYSSSGFSIPQRRVFIYMDEGRPLRPLLVCEPRGTLPRLEKFKGLWRDLVIGTYPGRETTQVYSTDFEDPLKADAGAGLDTYITELEPHQGVIEYIDPYEQNEAFLINQPEHILPETTHMEIHPSTILGILVASIPYANHNQSPRNQLSASQSKQGLSLYATNWTSRFDNNSHVLCYGEAPLSRTLYQDYIGGGEMPYGNNIVLAMGIYTGYNQEDGILMNADAVQRGLFRSVAYRTYEAFEEDDEKTKTRTRIANPAKVPGWLDINVGLDYSKLDESGIVKVGEYVDQNTVIVGKYLMSERGQMKDASLTPQVWTRGRVEKVVITVSNQGLRLVKIRVVQDRTPELGDKFSNRHGQKGTLNCLLRSQDMPHTADGIVPDMIMNPHAIPSRMTIGQLLESMGGKVGSLVGAINNATSFMNEGSPHEVFGSHLEQLGFEKYGNEIMYNTQTGDMFEAQIFIGNVYTMRLKHMTEDKWNARGEGRREQRTHQPTGGRGNEGGLKIGEMERDAITGHGIMTFTQESMMKRSDGTNFWICNGCGTVPIYNEKQNLFICSLCDGPIQFSGDTTFNLAPIPPSKRSSTTFSKVEMPYATKLFLQEMGFFLNVGLRLLTTKDVNKLGGAGSQVEQLEDGEEGRANIHLPLPELVYPEMNQPEVLQAPEPLKATNSEEATLKKLGALGKAVVAEATPVVTAPAVAEATLPEAPPPVVNAPAVVQAEPVLQQQAPPPAPAPAPAPNQPLDVINQNQEQEGPTIMVDTSAPAMTAEGLQEPVFGQEAPPAQAQSNQQRQSRRRSFKPRPSQPQQQVAMGTPAAAQLMQGGAEEEGETKMQYTTQITVQKLG